MQASLALCNLAVQIRIWQSLNNKQLFKSLLLYVKSISESEESDVANDYSYRLKHIEKIKKV